jgi:hypothetical protein
MNFRTVVMSALILTGFVFFVIGCSDSSAPDPAISGEGESLYEATVNPDDETFVLKRLDLDNPLGHFLELVGRNVVVVADSNLVQIDVAVRNAGEESIEAPLRIDIGRFQPPGVLIRNPDGENPPPERPWPGWLPFYFDYSATFGDDDLLAPDETSEFRTWEFTVPELTSFSFAATAHFMVGAEAILAGLLFEDHNRNGVFNPDTDEPLRFGMVTIQGPDDLNVTLYADVTGHYHLPLTATGLYTLTADPAIDGLDCPVFFTTPNPLEVVITPDEEGNPQGFPHANFGMVICPDDDPNDPPPVPVILTDADADELQGDDYYLRELRLTGNILRFDVMYGGCQADHPLQLFVSTRFDYVEEDDEEDEGDDDKQDELPATWAVLQHDQMGEDCEALWQRDAAFHLRALRHYVDERFGPNQRVLVVLVTPDGDTHEVVFGP